MMSTAQINYSKEDVEKIIRLYLEHRNITVKSVKLEVRTHQEDRSDFSYAVFDKAVVEIDPGDIVAQEDL